MDAEALKLVWTDLSYVRTRTELFRASQRCILPAQSGHITGGTITAVMGPSGAGKTTLVNCITGRTTRQVVGTVRVVGRVSGTVKLSIVPQKDALYEQFSVFETLLFASQAQNNCSKAGHRENVSKIIESLDLIGCKSTRVSKLSGGQKKRLSIGVELISNPDIMVLDEPTTGLDSSNAIGCVNLLKDIAMSRSMAILVVIHQPNNEVLKLFQMVYLMSKQGHNVYFGPTDLMLDHFKDTRKLTCPRKHSIGDFVLTIASNDSERFPDIEDDAIEAEPSIVGVSIAEATRENSNQPMSGLAQICLLFKRSFVASNLRSPLLIYSILFNVFAAYLVSTMYIVPIGREDGCKIGNANSILSAYEFREIFMRKVTSIMNAACTVYGTLLLMLMTTIMTSALALPLELHTIKRELCNGWYETKYYFLAKFASSIIEILVASVPYYVILINVSEQDIELWRAVSFFFIGISVAINAWLVGFLLGVLFCNNFKNSILSAVGMLFPFLFLSNFFVRFTQIRTIFIPLVYMNFLQPCFDMCLTVLYGLDRCPADSTFESIADQVAMASFPLKIVGDAMRTTSVNYKLIKRWAPALEIKPSVAVSVINATRLYVSSQKIDPVRTAHPSHMLEFYELPNDARNLPFDVLHVLTYMFILIFLVYCILRKTVKQ